MKPRLLLALLIVVWGVSWPVTKVGVSAIPPIWFACLRYVIATVLLGGVLVARRSFALPSRGDWRLIIVSGALQMATYAAFTSIALVHLPAGRASLLAFTTPLWVFPIAVWRGQERFSLRALAGVSLGMAGIAAIALPTLATSGASRVGPYALLIGAALAWALSLVVVRGHHFQLDPLTLSPWQTLVAGVLLCIAAALTEGTAPAIGARGLIALAYVAPVATAFAYWAVVEVGRQIPASTLSTAMLATPALGLVISAIVSRETIDPPLLGGMALIGGGIYLSTTIELDNPALPGE